MLSGGRRHHARSLATPSGTPIVFVVDEAVSVRESLELLIQSADWQAQTFASAQNLSRASTR
jgi:FixJ family two-component response regulator